MNETNSNNLTKKKRLKVLSSLQHTDDDCKGCITSYCCDLIMNGTTTTCPCRTCLVKMTCDQTCDRFNKAYQKIIGFPPTLNKG